MGRRATLTPEQREANRLASAERSVAKRKANGKYRIDQIAMGKRKNAIDNHVHADVSLREIREGIDGQEAVVDPVRGFNRGFFNLGIGCRHVRPRRACP